MLIFFQETISMKCQILYCLKEKNKKTFFKRRLLKFLPNMLGI